MTRMLAERPTFCNKRLANVGHRFNTGQLGVGSVHRLKQAMERRGRPPEAWWWATVDGRWWFTRLCVSTLYIFGLKRGVGVETRRAFFARLPLDTQVGCAPGALRHLRQALEATAGATAQTWEQGASVAGAVRASIGGVDATCLARLLVVLQDLPTGSLVLEDIAEDRTCATGHVWVEARLTALGTEVLSLGSDRAKAGMQRAEKGFACLSMPDFFPFVHDIVKSSTLAIGRRKPIRTAHTPRPCWSATEETPMGRVPERPRRRWRRSERR